MIVMPWHNKRPKHHEADRKRQSESRREKRERIRNAEITMRLLMTGSVEELKRRRR